MILLDGSSYLQAVCGGTANVDIDITYVDVDSTTYSPGAQSSIGRPAESPTICDSSEGSPAPSRKIKLISIRNTHETNDASIQLFKINSPGSYAISPEYTLLAGEMVHYIDGRGFVYYTATGIIKTT